jgi:hypothetical protein
MLRENLKSDVLYYDTVSEQYFYTPNAPGVIWIDDDVADSEFVNTEAVVVALEVI